MGIVYGHALIEQTDGVLKRLQPVILRPRCLQGRQGGVGIFLKIR